MSPAVTGKYIFKFLTSTRMSGCSPWRPLPVEPRRRCAVCSVAMHAHLFVAIHIDFVCPPTGRVVFLSHQHHGRAFLTALFNDKTAAGVEGASGRHVD